MLAFTEIEIWAGFYALMSILSFLILTLPSKAQVGVKSDYDALQITKETLEADEIEHYEVISIVGMKETDITTVIVETNVSGIAIEIDNLTGKVISKEKLIA